MTRFLIRRKDSTRRRSGTTRKLRVPGESFIDAIQAEADARHRQAKKSEKAAAIESSGVLASLVEARKQAGLTQSEIARRMGVPQPQIVRMESGAHSPTLNTICRYAEAVGVRVEVRVRT